MVPATRVGCRATPHAIPIAGRITHVADVFDAMTHPHPGHTLDRHRDAVGYITSESGFSFDPDVVAAFASAIRRA
jgi:response regulator RpfG family c-di-GMP phosphodiesterase